MKDLIVFGLLLGAPLYSFSKKVKNPDAPASSSSASSEVASSSEPSSSSSGIGFENTIANSACAETSWKNRGKAPAGFIKGMALVYARAECRARKGDALGKYLTGELYGSADVLTHYSAIFSALGLKNDSPSRRLKNLVSLAIGLGMRESSGRYCTGRDTSASNTTSDTAEAGLFQTSYNTVSTSNLRKSLITEYKAAPKHCLADIFKEGVKSCSSGDMSNFGTGAGRDFQEMSKACPAFAADVALVTMRVARTHYGPLVRREAEVVSACTGMLDKMEKELSPEACERLL